MDDEVDFTTDATQWVRRGSGALHRISYCGECIVCERRLYEDITITDDDPRGLLGEHLVQWLAESVVRVAVCFPCANKYETYMAAMRAARNTK